MYTVEFITHSGFDILANALLGTSLLFGDGSFNTLFTAILVLGVVMVAVAVGVGVAFDLKSNPLEWLKPAWWAVALYFILIVPKGTIVLYDDVENRSQTIGNLPVGLVLMAGFTNQIETAVSDKIATAMAPIIAVKDIGYGRTFDLYKNLFNSVGTSDVVNPYYRMTMRNYINDCVSWGVALGKISVDTINGNNNFTDVLVQASVYSSIYTTYYDNTSETRRKGETMTCAQAWTTINTDLWPPTKPTWDTAVKNFCAQNNFDPANASSLQECKSKIESFVQFITTDATTLSSNEFIRQAWISKIYYDYTFEGQAIDAAKMRGIIETNSTLVSSGLMANEYVYIIKAITTAILFGTTIIMALLVCTPFAKTALQYWLGMFLWVMLWGIMDTLLQNSALNYTYQIFQKNRDALGLGLGGMSILSENATKAVALLGNMRWLGMMLSASLTFGVFKFGGDAFTSFAGSLGSAAQGSGASAGARQLTPEGQAATMKSAVQEVIPTAQIASRYSAEAWGNAYTTNEASRIGESSGLGSPERAFDTSSYNADLNASTVQSKKSLGLTPGREALAHATETSVGIETTEKTTAAFGGAPQHIEQASDTKAQNNVTDLNTYRRPGGSLKTNMGGDLVSAQIDGFAANLSEGRKTALTDSASKSLASSVDFNQLMSSGSTFAKNYGVSESYANELSNSMSHNLGKEIESDTSLRDVKESNTGTTLHGAAKAGIGGGIIWKASAEGGYAMQFNTKDGKTHSFTMSQEQKEAFSKAEQSAARQTFSEALSTSKGREESSRLAKTVGATEAQNNISQLSQEKTLSDQVSNDMTAAYVRMVGNRDFGGINDNRERYKAALDSIAEARSSGAPEKLKSLNEDVGRFMSTYGEKGVIDFKNEATEKGISGQSQKALLDLSGKVDNATKNIEKNASGMPIKLNGSGEPLKKVDEKGFNQNYSSGAVNFDNEKNNMPNNALGVAKNSVVEGAEYIQKKAASYMPSVKNATDKAINAGEYLLNAVASGSVANAKTNDVSGVLNRITPDLNVGTEVKKKAIENMNKK